jgi:hypothetical protein
MTKYTAFLFWIVAGVVLIAIGASLYELDRRGQSQFADLAGRIDEINDNLRALSRNLRGESALREAAYRNEIRKELNVVLSEMIQLRSEMGVKNESNRPRQ